jgi:hypothetical protein
MSDENLGKLNLYSMDLHHSITVDRYTEIMRVAGGWIYIVHSSDKEEDDNPTSIFVPFNNEFQKN